MLGSWGRRRGSRLRVLGGESAAATVALGVHVAFFIHFRPDVILVGVVVVVAPLAFSAAVRVVVAVAVFLLDDILYVYVADVGVHDVTPWRWRHISASSF